MFVKAFRSCFRLTETFFDRLMLMVDENILIRFIRKILTFLKENKLFVFFFVILRICFWKRIHS